VKNYSALNDSELVTMFKNSDQAAFGEIHRRYFPLLYNFAVKKGIGADEIKDIIQDLFLWLWQNRIQFNLQCSLESYLFKSVFNRILDLFRHLKIRDEYLISFNQAMPLKAKADADYSIREKDMERLISMEINALPERMRSCVLLRSHEFLSNKEIGGKLGITEQTVETHMKKALKLLRRKLAVRILMIFFNF
jgi:RNA polymerase sigma-70 factor (family 1)